MSELSKYLVEGILREAEQGITVLLPGGFKPPHGGHLDLAMKYAALPQVSEVRILIGPKGREGITREQSVAIWKLLLGGKPNIKVESVAEDNPLLAAYKYVETIKPGTYALAASSKGDDYTRVQKFVAGHQPGAKYGRPNVNVVELPLNTKPLLYTNRPLKGQKAAPGKSENGKGISASVLRVDLANSDYDSFKTNYPNVKSESVLKAVYDILKKNLKESKLRVFDFDDTLVQTSNKIYVNKWDGRKIQMTPGEYAVYQPDERDTFDFSDFDSPIKSAEELTKYTAIMRRVLKAPGRDRRVVVLTARSNAQVVYDYLMKLGIRVPIVAVGSADPMDKARWIEKQIAQGYDDIYFLDDSAKNIAAVKSLSSKYPDVKLVTQIVTPKDAPAQNFLNENMLLLEGGAAGHLAHPYEDIELTFSDVKNMITAALSGKLEYAQEKLDGQNLMISYIDGKVRAARNKGQIKNFGQNSLTTDQLASMFAGRGSIETAFVESMTDLENAINKLSKEQKQKFFDNGKRFISLEILYPPTTNVVPYGASQIRMHHFKVYDQEGNIINEDVTGIYELQKALEVVQAQEQKTFKIKTTDPAKLKQDLDLENQLSYFTNMIKSIQSKYALKDSDKMSLYFQNWWKGFIERNAKAYKAKLTPGLQQLLVSRWAFSDKSTKISAIKQQIQNPEFLAWVEEFDRTQVEINKKIAAKPIENLFLQLGVRVLTNIENLTTINPESAVKQMKQDVKDAIARIEAAAASPDYADNDAPMRFLKRELLRLKNIGGFKAILPTEGIVFKYNNKLYKLTGAFAPINQILGYLRF
jgi:hypothetical protein